MFEPKNENARFESEIPFYCKFNKDPKFSIFKINVEYCTYKFEYWTYKFEYYIDFL